VPGHPGGGTSYEALTDLAAAVPPGSEGLVFLPYLAGERTPHLDPDARGAWVGLSLAHGPGHLVRSVLEGVAFSLRRRARCGRPLAPVEALLATGGGARSRLWLEIVSGVLGLPLERPQAEEGAAYGAAYWRWPARAPSLARGRPRPGTRRRRARRAPPRACLRPALERYRRLYPALKAALG
jgi:xylulokinase